MPLTCGNVITCISGKLDEREDKGGKMASVKVRVIKTAINILPPQNK